jgi:hypothetical protein
VSLQSWRGAIQHGRRVDPAVVEWSLERSRFHYDFFIGFFVIYRFLIVTADKGYIRFFAICILKIFHSLLLSSGFRFYTRAFPLTFHSPFIGVSFLGRRIKVRLEVLCYLYV